MLNCNQTLGVQGEFQVVVRRADGSVRLDTGMQPNLVLDNAIKFYIGDTPTVGGNGNNTNLHRGNSINSHCLVGAGNTPPQVTNTNLQAFEAVHSSIVSTNNEVEQPTSTLHPNFVKLIERTRFAFSGLVNKNISEVGLASNFSSSGSTHNYILMTRALIKDVSGSPLTITVLDGEILEVVYQLNMFVDIRRKTGSFTLTTMKQGSPNTTATFDYFQQCYNPQSTQLGGRILLNSDSGTQFYTYGVKETDGELTASYDLNSTEWQKITPQSTSALSGLTTGQESLMVSTNVLIRAAGYEVTKVDFATKSYTAKATVYHLASNFPNGIRAFTFGRNVNYMVIPNLVVVKNRANGQGIKKTDQQRWEFTMTVTVDRWSD